MSERLDVKTLQLSDEGKLAIHAALLALDAIPAWDVLRQLLAAQGEATLRVGLMSYEKPADVAFMAGRYEALEFLRTLPERFATVAAEIMKGRQEEEEMHKVAGSRRIPRANTTGEVSS